MHDLTSFVPDGTRLLEAVFGDLIEVGVAYNTSQMATSGSGYASATEGIKQGRPMNGQRNHIANLVLIVAAFIAPAATAQCVTGVDTGGACIPPDAAGMPGYNASGNAPTPPPVKWADSWGAIVIDANTGSAGTVIDRLNRSQAVSDATRDCASKGASGCKVMEAYYNQCAAIAWGSGGFGTAANPTIEGAERDAMTACNRNASECKVVYNACSTAHRIN
jgi:hypothetical protein